MTTRRAVSVTLPRWTLWVVFIGSVLGTVWITYQFGSKVRSDGVQYARGFVGEQIADSLDTHRRVMHRSAP